MVIDMNNTEISSGLPSLDQVLQGVQAGDNIVWQVNNIEEYIPFVHAFCKESYEKQKKLIYFRFGHHQQLLPDGIEANVYELQPDLGFETFISQVFEVIEKYDKGACYVFDNLSDLADDWYSDMMLGNFFMLTCPYLFDFDTATYFAIIRNRHGARIIEKIQNTAQVVIDVFNQDLRTFIHPLKVLDRSSPTMYMLHEKRGHNFIPVLSSGTISEILTGVQQPWVDLTAKRLDVWARTLRKAQEILDRIGSSEISDSILVEWKHRLIRMMIAREAKVSHLASEYLDLKDLLRISKRIIGSGLIGGKSVGMIIARAILESSDSKWSEKLEIHDSFFIGSDVFYTYLVENGIWWKRRKLVKGDAFLDGLDEVQLRIYEGHFSQSIQDQFLLMLVYYGQSPIIVRSSSLLEDAYGNAFSGKYESIFLANQGTPEQRLSKFISAVKEIYASTISRNALTYRKKRGLLDKDEQMALLVQRVSGSMHGNNFFPQLAGVGFSYNPYVWDPSIKPESGVARIVFGLGTRAVERKDDYTCLVALNVPEKKIAKNEDELRKYTQKKVDLIDLEQDRLSTIEFNDILPDIENQATTSLFTEIDIDSIERLRERNRPIYSAYSLTFRELFKRTDFVEHLEELLQTIEDAYESPVDVEFTANFKTKNDYLINLLQCRPFQVRQETFKVRAPEQVDPNNIVFKTKGPIIGRSRLMDIDFLIYVRPEIFGQIPVKRRYAVARAIGVLTHDRRMADKRIMLIGPGRWGTASPELGIPISFPEIENVTVIGEIAQMHEGLIPDVSLGTHFFNDLVEMDMLYFAVYPGRTDLFIKKTTLKKQDNVIHDYLTANDETRHAITLYEFIGNSGGSRMHLFMDSLKQEGICYLD